MNVSENMKISFKNRNFESFEVGQQKFRKV